MNHDRTADEPARRGGDIQITDIVDANHILFDRGILDAYGHVSARDRDDPSRFLLARNMAPALVSTDDIQIFDLDGETADPRPSYLEDWG